MFRAGDVLEKHVNISVGQIDTVILLVGRILGLFSLQHVVLFDRSDGLLFESLLSFIMMSLKLLDASQRWLFEDGVHRSHTLRLLELFLLNKA